MPNFTIRADFEITGNHVDDGGSLRDVPVTAIHGADDRTVQAADMTRWSEKSGFDFEFVQVDGGHFFIHRHERRHLTLRRAVSDATGWPWVRWPSTGDARDGRIGHLMGPIPRAS